MPVDYSLYPANWLTEIRPRILARANDRCEECAVPNGLLIVRTREADGRYHWRRAGLLDPLAVKAVLTISHTDHDITHNDDANLRALCQRCHLEHDREHHQRNAAETRRRKRAAMGQAALPLALEGR